MSSPTQTNISESANYGGARYSYQSLSNYTNYTCQSDCMCATNGKDPRTNYDEMMYQFYVVGDKPNPIPPASSELLQGWSKANLV